MRNRLVTLISLRRDGDDKKTDGSILLLTFDTGNQHVGIHQHHWTHIFDTRIIGGTDYPHVIH
jgi:hypothetical protein